MAQGLIKFLKKKITIIIVPHSTSHPIRSSVSSLLIFSLFTIWAGSFGWAVWVISKKINYEEALKSNLALKQKSEFLTRSIAESRNYLEQVKDMETRLRGILNLKSKKDIIELSRVGGPSIHDESIIAQLLKSGKDYDLEETAMNLREMKRDSWLTTQGFRKIEGYINEEKGKLLSTPCIWPAPGTITSRFGWRIHPLSKRREFHKALDIAAAKGVSIRATADGKVILSGWQGSYGKAIMISHGHGFSTHYCHNDSLLVKTGNYVKRGQIIATIGSTGRTTGPHIHYEVWYKGKAVNPMNYLSKK